MTCLLAKLINAVLQRYISDSMIAGHEKDMEFYSFIIHNWKVNQVLTVFFLGGGGGGLGG